MTWVSWLGAKNPIWLPPWQGQLLLNAPSLKSTLSSVSITVDIGAGCLGVA